MDFFVLLAYASLTASRTSFATINSLSELYFRFRRFIFFGTNEKNDFSELCKTSTWKPWRWVMLGFRWEIYTSISTWACLQNSLAAEVLSLNISSHDILSNDHENRPNQHKNIHKQYYEIGYAIVNMMESQWKLQARN